MAQDEGRTPPATSTRAAARRPGNTPTMRDIAEATSVSQSTVSRVLSGTPTAVPIAEATRKRVMETAQELGYRPNPLARGLRGAPTMLIGVIVRDEPEPPYSQRSGSLSAQLPAGRRRGPGRGKCLR